QQAGAFRTQHIFFALLEPGGRLDERLQLLQPSGRRSSVLRQLVVTPTCGTNVAPGAAGLAAKLSLPGTAVAVDQIELVGRPGQAALFELAGHRNQTLDGGRQILARDRPPPGVSACTAVPEDPSRRDEPRLVLRPELRDRGDALVVEESS